MNETPSQSPPGTPPGTALVTGASAGIGAAIARRLVADGWRVVATARRLDRLQALADELGSDRVLPFAMDVADRDAVAALPGSLPGGWQAIDLLVNNAGLALGREPAQGTDSGDWERMVEANVNGLMRCTHALLPGMVERGRGHIVNIGSLAGQLPYPGGNVYGASKAFVRHFSYGLIADLIATPVRCTVIEPGLVAGSEFSNVRFKGDDERAASIYENAVPLLPPDIAESVAWVVRQPAHVNVSLLQVLPTCQGPGPVAVHRSHGV